MSDFSESDSTASVAPQPATAGTPDQLALISEMGMEDYAAERKDLDAEGDGDPAVDSHDRKTARLDRYRRAMGIAQQASSAVDDGEASYRPDDAARSEDHEARIRREAEFGVRAKDYYKDKPAARDEMAAIFALYQPSDHVTDLIMKSEIGPAMAHEMSKYPDAILELNEASPADAARILGMLEGRLRTTQQFEERNRATPRARHQTAAPPPLRPVTGGAAPSMRLEDMSMADYAKARRAQDAVDRR